MTKMKRSNKCLPMIQGGSRSKIRCVLFLTNVQLPLDKGGLILTGLPQRH